MKTLHNKRFPYGRQPIGVEIRIFISEAPGYGKSIKKGFKKLPPASITEMSRQVKGKPGFCSGGNVFVTISGNFKDNNTNHLV